LPLTAYLNLGHAGDRDLAIFQSCLERRRRRLISPRNWKTELLLNHRFQFLHVCLFGLIFEATTTLPPTNRCKLLHLKEGIGPRTLSIKSVHIPAKPGFRNFIFWNVILHLSCMVGTLWGPHVVFSLCGIQNNKSLSLSVCVVQHEPNVA